MSSAISTTATSEPSQTRNSWRPTWWHFENTLASTKSWWIICSCCAAILAWSARHYMNPDGLSYLDMACEALRGGPSQLVNGYWSPGYPALIDLVFLIFRPSPGQEFPVIHLLNFGTYLLEVWGFCLFLNYWFRAIDKHQTVSATRRRTVTIFAFSTFVWFTLRFIGLDGVNPDICVSTIVIFAAALCCRLTLPDSGWKHYIALGALLGVGYYMKAALFPLSLVLLASLFVLPPVGIRRFRLLASLAIFLLTSTPLLVALSRQEKKFTFGETGRLNYLWYVNGLLWAGGLEPPEDHTIPDHPAPKLLTKPVTLAFATPVHGTFPLWYDPSYWYADSRVHYSISQQIAALGQTLKAFKDMTFDSAAFFAGAIALWVISRGRQAGRAVLHDLWWLIAWPLAAFVMYAFVHAENRFMGGFFVVFWIGVYGALILRVSRRVSSAVFTTVICAAMIPFLAHLGMETARVAKDLVHPKTPEYETGGRGLINLGLQPGDRLAVVGYAHNCYYAHYAKLRVAAQIPDSQEFWRLTPPELKTVEDRLASIGVKALVATNRPDTVTTAGWKDLKLSESARLSVLLLSPQALSATAAN